MTQYRYTDRESEYFRTLMEVRGVLLQRRSEYRNKLEVLELQLKNTERCHDAWTAEALFRRGIPMSKLGSVAFEVDHLEVRGDK